MKAKVLLLFWYCLGTGTVILTRPEKYLFPCNLGKFSSRMADFSYVFYVFPQNHKISHEGASHQVFFYIIFFFLFVWYRHISYLRQGKWRGNWVPFSLCVNALEWRPYWRSCMEVSYCTCGFGAVIRHNLRTLSLPCDSLRNNHYARVIKSTQER